MAKSANKYHSISLIRIKAITTMFYFCFNSFIIAQQNNKRILEECSSNYNSITHSEWNNVIKRIFDELSENIKYSILQDESRVNAFVFNEECIVITTGLLNQIDKKLEKKNQLKNLNLGGFIYIHQ